MNYEAYSLVEDLAKCLVHLRCWLLILEFQLVLPVIIPDHVPWRWRIKVHPLAN